MSRRRKHVAGSRKSFEDEDAETLLDAALRRFPPNNRHSVFGFDVGARIERGIQLRELTLRLYVERKWPHTSGVPGKPLSLRVNRRTVIPDVVATGSRPRTLEGNAPAFSGVHTGAALLVSRRHFGGVGAILGLGDGPTHLLTAGHLFAEGAEAAPVQCAPAGGAPKTIGKLVCNLLDSRRGSRAIDVALVMLNEHGVELALRNESPRPPRPRALFDSELDDVLVQAFRPTAHDYSTSNAISTLPRAVHLVSSARPGGYTVRGVLRSAQEITRSGDSGTAVLIADPTRELVGTCVGVDGRGSLIEPVRRALDRLSVITRSRFVLWKRN